MSGRCFRIRVTSSRKPTLQERARGFADEVTGVVESSCDSIPFHAVYAISLTGRSFWRYDGTLPPHVKAAITRYLNLNGY